MTHTLIPWTPDTLAPTVTVGDVVQIDPASSPVFGGAFLVVTEVKPWGVVGYVMIPGQPGVAFYRAEAKDVTRIGRAEWIENT